MQQNSLRGALRNTVLYHQGDLVAGNRLYPTAALRPLLSKHEGVEIASGFIYRERH